MKIYNKRTGKWMTVKAFQVAKAKLIKALNRKQWDVEWDRNITIPLIKEGMLKLEEVK